MAAPISSAATESAIATPKALSRQSWASELHLDTRYSASATTQRRTVALFQGPDTPTLGRRIATMPPTVGAHFLQLRQECCGGPMTAQWPKLTVDFHRE